MASMDIVNNQNVVERIVHLPLVISTYDLVSNVYCNTKNNHPYLKSVCEVAENGVKSITSAAFHSALPIIGKLEPQISMANDLACKGLDKIERTLPILHKPSDQIVASAKEAVTGAKEAVSGTMNGAKESVSSTLSEVTDRTRGAVQESMEKTKTVVSGGVQTVMESRVVKLMSSSPIGKRMKKTLEKPGSMNEHSVVLVKITITQILLFSFNQQIESRTLTIAHNLSQQLQSTCLVLVSSFKGLPQHIQVQAVSVSHSAMEIYSSFSKAAAIGDLSNSVLTTSRSQLSRIRDSMDNVMDYLLNNTPLNWLVGPFYPRAERGAANGPECDKPRTLRVTE
ncbi:perilipin-2-like [Sinocyclocheilus grahami]|uniref:perilipin-2-like n=1 Tax=Sinocyclocheilus grahami TaxID=75366 RepID=UPI0007AC8C28|nr:PREDICTED: perilipin-2-like [Sinocyclocheilus grahami]